MSHLEKVEALPMVAGLFILRLYNGLYAHVIIEL